MNTQYSKDLKTFMKATEPKPVKKVTLTTIKSFIRNNADKLLIKQKSSFDGMVDMVTESKDHFRKVDASKINFAKNSYGSTQDHTYGIPGAWFIEQSRDYFTPYETSEMIGYNVYNCCGEFYLAILK